MYELKKKLERYLRVNLLGPGPRLMEKEFTGPRSHKGCIRWQQYTQDNYKNTHNKIDVGLERITPKYIYFNVCYNEQML